MTSSHQHSPRADHEPSHSHSHSRQPDHEPWQDLPPGFAERLDREAKLSAPITDEAITAAVTALAATPSTILDLGAGTGAGTIALATRFSAARVHGLDVSPELLEAFDAAATAAGVADRVHGHRADLDGEWPAALPAGVDLVWAALSLHHVADPARVLRQAFAALRPGGVLVIIEKAGAGEFEPNAALTAAGFTTLNHYEPTSTTGRAVWVATRREAKSEPIESDVVVVGGGSAGLAAAVALARSRRHVVLVDAGQPRNAPAEGAHNLLGNEGISPLDLLARGRAEAEGYGVRIVSGRATAVTGTIDDFRLEVDGGAHHVRARRLILATGLVDDLLDVPGIAQAWGRTVLHCPFCHGWEVRDQRISILTRDEVAVHQALLFSQLSDQVTLFLHEAADPTEEQWEQLAALNVSVVQGRVEQVVVDGTQVQAVEIEGGRTFATDAVVIAPKFLARTELYEALGGEATTTAFGRQIQADGRGMTAIAGVWAAGNASDPMAMVTAAAAAGVMTGAAVHGDLAFADLNRAMAARRAAA